MFALAVLLIVLPLLPVWMRSVYRRVAMLDNRSQRWVYVWFHFCLAIAIFLSFFLAWFSFFFSYMYFGPYLTGSTPNLDYWDSGITPRGVVFLLIMLGVPYLVFSKIGLVSIRDTHQLCKEQRDRLAKRKKTGWEGVKPDRRG